MGYPNHSNGSMNLTNDPALDNDEIMRAHIAQRLARIETNQQEIREQQQKDSAQLTEIVMVLNELLPYARRAAAMMDNHPLAKLRTAFGKHNATPGNQ